VDDLRTRFRAAYGAAGWHLLILLASFTLIAWVVLRLAAEPTRGRMLLWFLGAVIAHDLVLFPIYALADRALRRVVRAGPRSIPPASALNHLRVPALAAGLLFLVFLPGILRQGRDTYLAATGQDQQPYLGRWLVISAALFLLSGLWYAVTLLRRQRTGARPPTM
jgi:hypothetical protein